MPPNHVIRVQSESCVRRVCNNRNTQIDMLQEVNTRSNPWKGPMLLMGVSKLAITNPLADWKPDSCMIYGAMLQSHAMKKVAEDNVCKDKFLKQKHKFPLIHKRIFAVNGDNYYLGPTEVDKHWHPMRRPIRYFELVECALRPQLY